MTKNPILTLAAENFIEVLSKETASAEDIRNAALGVVWPLVDGDLSGKESATFWHRSKALWAGTASSVAPSGNAT